MFWRNKYEISSNVNEIKYTSKIEVLYITSQGTQAMTHFRKSPEGERKWTISRERERKKEDVNVSDVDMALVST